MILLISSAYNGLCQRAHVELEALGHDISITLALNPDDIRKGVTYFQPNLIICPFLKEKIPEDIWSRHLCLIVHPGIKGDRGPSSLDWAIMNDEKQWGVTVLQAVEEMDAGEIWGKDTKETQAWLTQKHGKNKPYLYNSQLHNHIKIRKNTRKYNSKY